MSSRSIRGNTTGTSNLGADFTGTATSGGKFSQDTYIQGGTVVQNQSPVTRRTYNVPLASADTESSLVLPADIAGYMIRAREAGVLKLSHTSGESGTNYITIPARATMTDDHRYQNLTIYFQSPSAGTIVEVVAWEL